VLPAGSVSYEGQAASANPRHLDAFACPLPGAASLNEVLMRSCVLYIIGEDVTNVLVAHLLTLALRTRQRTPERMLRGA
jgi:hypothetical protein